MKHDLSIIIVNYKVCFFLEQTLISVQKAIKLLNIEVFVVDNCSDDGSAEMVARRFPWVKLIVNKQNVGFSKANNQAIVLSDSDFVLLLNPDTILQEDTLEKCFTFMSSDPQVGGLGVKMIDGSGLYLPESKRGLPTPWVSFCKICGLSTFFKTSPRFNGYHLGYLDKNQNHEVEVLSGAFMMLRKATLDKIGLLDEDYFMYGEDIDISYRIIQAGFKNVYFAETEIVHYKGESTKRSSTNYVRIFYGAMSTFAAKHFNTGYARIFSILLTVSIQLRAFVAIVARYVFRYGFVVFSSTLIFGAMVFLKQWWEQNYKPLPGQYPSLYLTVIIPVYILIWALSVYYSGGFDKPFKNYRIIRGVIVGTVIISAFSNFMDTFRYSKTLMVLGAFSASSIWILFRYVSNYLNYRKFSITELPQKRTIIIGNQNEAQRVSLLLSKIYKNADVIGHVSVENSFLQLGNLRNLQDLVSIYQPNSFVFCNESLSYAQIMEIMKDYAHLHIEYNIVPSGRDFMIGSQSKNTQGELHTLDPHLALFEPQNLRKKRIVEVFSAIIILLFSPIVIFKIKRNKIFFYEIMLVLIHKKTFVGVSHMAEGHRTVSVITPWTVLEKRFSLDMATKKRIEMIYAKDYTPLQDVKLIWKWLIGH